MQGKNELILCTAEMIEAVQYYLNNKVFTEEHKTKVITIKERMDGHCTVFMITLKDEENVEG